MAPGRPGQVDVEVVTTRAEARALEKPPYLVLDALTDYLDSQGLGSGQVSWRRTGEGQSNHTYRITRTGADLVLRRGPRPPVPPSTHDMVREAGILVALHASGYAVPEVVTVCQDPEVLGAPFYLMRHLDGVVITQRLPPSMTLESRRRVGGLIVDALADLHDLPTSTPAIAALGRPEGYLTRQLKRFRGLWPDQAPRHFPQFHQLADWLTQHQPPQRSAAVVHGDYRLGNLMLGPDPSAPRLLAVLDWEMATLGDPLADLGYLTATYSEAGSTPTPLDLSPVTRLPGFATRAELARAYSERTGADLRDLPWYEVLALWKAAAFCEAIYRAWLAGERPADTRFAPSLEQGVPTLLAEACRRAE